MKLTLVKRQQISGNCYEYWFKPEQPFVWQAGQYLKYSLAHEQPDDRGITRKMSIGTAPGDEMVSLITRFYDNGSTFKSALSQLQIGDSIEAAGPDGDFVLPSQSQLPLVCIAGGIGIAPYKAMIDAWIQASSPYVIKLIYANKNSTDIPYRLMFEEWADKHPQLHLKLIASESADPAVALSRVSIELLREVAGSVFGQSVFYIAGPKLLTKELKGKLKDVGIPKPHIIKDSFSNYDVYA